MSVPTTAPASPHPAPRRYTRQELRRMDKAEARDASDRLLLMLRGLDPENPQYGDIRGILVELNLPLVRYAARRFGHRGANQEDVHQTGVVGLIKAIDAFDTDRGVEFATFALPTISGEIKRFFRDTAWPVHVNRGLQERFLAVARATDRLEQRLCRTPSEAEVADEVDLTADEVQEVRGASHAYLVESLDAATPQDGAHAARAPLADRLAYEEGDYALVEFRESVKPLMAELPYRERLLLELRFWGELPQREIGARLGVSQMHVSRLLSATLARLRERLESDAPPGSADSADSGEADHECRPQAAFAAVSG